MSKSLSCVKLVTYSPDETRKVAESLAPFLEKGDILSLTGDLGAGKTCFIQGLARGLKVRERVASPTFTLIKEYHGNMPLYHFDVYRLKNHRDLFDLGYEEYFFGDGVTVVEWGDKTTSLFPPDYLELRFERTSQENVRDIIVKPYGNWQKRIKEWLKSVNTYS